MKKFILIITLFKSIALSAQECPRIFRTSITYSNTSLGLNYNNTPTEYAYQVYKRTTNDRLTNSCEILDIKRPIIICEGFDFMNQVNPSDIYKMYINNNNYGNLLRSQGYDIITYNITQPTLALQTNAILFSQFIDFINKNKTGNEENIIMG
ncbi:MAG: hypothetical protein EAZ07_09660 [Cytophagales bacterium]|nr:MAG: hypothetical protein EAZ07_09660 [Cytophagales bacterium]